MCNIYFIEEDPSLQIERFAITNKNFMWCGVFNKLRNILYNYGCFSKYTYEQMHDTIVTLI